MQEYREFYGPLFLPMERQRVVETANVDQECHSCGWVGKPTRPQLCPDCGTRDVLSLADDVAGAKTWEEILEEFDDCPAGQLARNWSTDAGATPTPPVLELEGKGQIRSDAFGLRLKVPESQHDPSCRTISSCATACSCSSAGTMPAAVRRDVAPPVSHVQANSSLSSSTGRSDTYKQKKQKGKKSKSPSLCGSFSPCKDEGCIDASCVKEAIDTEMRIIAIIP